MNKNFPFTFLVFFTLLLILNSCTKENDPTPVSTTSSSPNARFLGNWSVSEHSSLYGPSSYPLKIVDSTNNSYILFVGLYGFHKNTTGKPSGSNISIPSQIIDGTRVSGSGTLVNTSRITLTYYVDDGSYKDTVTAILTK